MGLKKKYKKLLSELLKYNHSYYILNKSLVSDAEYDRLLKELSSLEKEYPNLIDPNSPTQTVGSLVNYSGAHKHLKPMYSLDNVYSIEELGAYLRKVEKTLSSSLWLIEDKIDGVSINLHYRHGILIKAVTRGDGHFGEDVTNQAKLIDGIPHKLKGNNHPSYIEVRGEVYMEIKTFNALNSEITSRYKNPRNTASGSLRLKDLDEVRNRHLKFLGYGIGIIKGHPGFNYEIEIIEALSSWGFEVVNFLNQSMQLEIEDIKKIYTKTIEDRPSRKYEIDGIVFKLLDIKGQEHLGFTKRAPRWAIAFKFPSDQGVTTLLDIEWSIGKLGTLTPVGIIKPIILNGVTIKRVNLYNHHEIERLRLSLNAKVTVKRSADVIPKILGVNEEGDKRIVYPITCPSCNHRLKVIDHQLTCVNTHGCKAILLGLLMHYVSKDGLFIKGLGKEILSQLIDKKKIYSFSSLYKLTMTDLTSLERVGEKLAIKILENISLSKLASFDKVLSALSIPNLGKGKAGLLSTYFNNLNSLVEADNEEILTMAGLGSKTRESILAYRITHKEELLLLDRLLKAH